MMLPMKVVSQSLSEKPCLEAGTPECDSHQLLASCVTQGKSLKFSVPWFPHLQGEARMG